MASELRRRFGAFSRADEARQAVLTGTVDDGGAELPAGRDWQADVRVGVHAHPSMSHLHVHVLSRDMHSANARHRKHYNSFTTPFFVPLADFPLAADDPRRKSPGGSGRGTCATTSCAGAAAATSATGTRPSASTWATSSSSGRESDKKHSDTAYGMYKHTREKDPHLPSHPHQSKH